jgi:hypothetical protein
MYLENGSSDLPYMAAFSSLHFHQTFTALAAFIRYSRIQLTNLLATSQHFCLLMKSHKPSSFLEAMYVFDSILLPNCVPCIRTLPYIYIFLCNEAVPSTVSPVHSSSFSIAVHEVTNNTPSHTRLANPAVRRTPRNSASSRNRSLAQFSHWPHRLRLVRFRLQHPYSETDQNTLTASGHVVLTQPLIFNSIW